MADLPSWAKKGALVVCIDGGTSSRSVGGWAPKTNGIYTIRGVSVFPEYGACLLLVEYVHPEKTDDGQEWGWQASRFRPLVTDSNDGEIETVLYRKRKHQHFQRVPHLGTVS